MQWRILCDVIWTETDEWIKDQMISMSSGNLCVSCRMPWWRQHWQDTLSQLSTSSLNRLYLDGTR